MAKDTKTLEKIEREYTIPLREKSRPVSRYKKTPKAIKTIKEFLVRHMKIRDRDLKKIKLDKYLNEIMWQRGIKKHPHKIKVKAIKEGDIVRVEAVELPKNLNFKKLKEEKRNLKTKELAEKKKSALTKFKEKSTETKEQAEQKPEESKEQKEKSEAGKQIEKQIAKIEAKKSKAQSIKQPKQPKHPQRKALAK